MVLLESGPLGQRQSHLQVNKAKKITLHRESPLSYSVKKSTYQIPVIIKNSLLAILSIADQSLVKSYLFSVVMIFKRLHLVFCG